MVFAFYFVADAPLIYGSKNRKYRLEVGLQNKNSYRSYMLEETIYIYEDKQS